MWTTYFNNIMVVSILLLTMACLTVPARADVYITATPVGETNEVIISFDATSETNLIRAFAFDIQLCNDANIVSVTGLSSDYYIYPSTILIDAQGNVIDFGSPVAEYSDLPSGTLTGLDSNGITIEMASLYAPVGPGSPNAPAKSGNLLSIIGSYAPVDLCSPNASAKSGDSLSIIICDYVNITPNVARAGPTGVVMENPNEVVTVHYPRCDPNYPPPPPECMKRNAPEYPEWDVWDKPKCWCYARQCRGDADGIRTGPFWVAIPDLNAFRAAFNKTDVVLQTVTNGICSDLDHVKTGPFRVAIPDLNIFRLYFNKIETLVPECPSENYNWWETP